MTNFTASNSIKCHGQTTAAAFFKKVAAPAVLCCAVLSLGFYEPLTGDNETGDYGDSCDSAHVIEIPSAFYDTGEMEVSVQGAIDSLDDIDYFAVTLPSPGRLQIHTTGTTDTYGYIKDAACETVIESGDVESVGKNFYIIHTTSGPGTYYIAVRHKLENATGPYTLVVKFTEEQVPEDMDDAFCPAAVLLEHYPYGLRVLREFRDEHLSRTAAGRACVRWYYRHARTITFIVLSCPRLRSAATVLLEEVFVPAADEISGRMPEQNTLGREGELCMQE